MLERYYGRGVLRKDGAENSFYALLGNEKVVFTGEFKGSCRLETLKKRGAVPARTSGGNLGPMQAEKKLRSHRRK